MDDARADYIRHFCNRDEAILLWLAIVTWEWPEPPTLQQAKLDMAVDSDKEVRVIMGFPDSYIKTIHAYNAREFNEPPQRSLLCRFFQKLFRKDKES